MNDPYQPGEREAMNGLYTFENVTLKRALEKAFPGSAQDLFVSGIAVDFMGKVPVITDIKNKDEVQEVIANAYQIDKNKVNFLELEPYKLRNPEKTSVSNNYIPYKTVDRMVFGVDWKDTKDENLLKYINYIRKSWAERGQRNLLREGINKPTQDRIANFALDVFLDRRYGNSKFTEYIADVEVGSNYLDIAFDFQPSEVETVNGLSGKPSKVIHPTPTEIEVTEKRIDKFMIEEFPRLFFRYYKVTPFFRIEKVEHKWLDDTALACLYNIIQINERK